MFDPANPEERAAAAAASEELCAAYAKVGFPCGRVPADMQAGEMARRDDTFRAVLDGIKRTLDPRGVLSPGRYGIG